MKPPWIEVGVLCRAVDVKLGGGSTFGSGRFLIKEFNCFAHSNSLGNIQLSILVPQMKNVWEQIFDACLG